MSPAGRVDVLFYLQHQRDVLARVCKGWDAGLVVRPPHSICALVGNPGAANGTVRALQGAPSCGGRARIGYGGAAACGDVALGGHRLHRDTVPGSHKDAIGP